MLAGSFLGDANSRLLPASIPFGFFAAAAVFHMAAWVALFVGAGDVAGFAGGPGPVLAAIHLLTLGVLAMVAIGASFQLLPVATRQPLIRIWPARLCFWLMVPGVVLLSGGMTGASTLALQIGSGMVASALFVFAALSADNLRRAGAMPVVAAHCWAALCALAISAGLGVIMITDFSLGFLTNHTAVAVAHMLLAAFGFMGLLVLGFSLILIPMFALSRSLPTKPTWAQMWLAVLAIAFAAIAVFADNAGLFLAAIVIAVSAASVYLWLMGNALRTGMRKRLGISMLLVRLSWGLLLVALLLGFCIIVDIPAPNLPALFGFTVLVGWLLTFLLGVLQRIVPFLASMHASGKGGLPPLLSDLTPDLPLKLHAGFHLIALVACSVGILFDSTRVLQIGESAGFAGSVAFAVFLGLVLSKLNASPPKA